MNFLLYIRESVLERKLRNVQVYSCCSQNKLFSYQKERIKEFFLIFLFAFEIKAECQVHDYGGYALYYQE